MKKILLSIFMTTCSIQLFAQSESQKAVRQTVVNMFARLADLDSANIRNYCTSDVVFYETGKVWNLDSLIKKGITANMGTGLERTNKFDFINTTIQENIAWVTYNLYSDIQKGERTSAVHWMETVILVKEKKEWKIKVLHSTLIKRT